ncbi:helix-turn-helix domain-containing protein [Coprococcus comes]|uniref:helix-turn-helix domain-containing protein n=1 Tax=Coprococcus comes TaxID=410072 RepID=UPI001571428C|nr:helix-turn-helix domain-containing protein [Coprococcus comes]NSD15725.1 helix-turn-helix domain-containing protein [Coprococcus comes]NSG44446.1 helix-turn-helix domain-containing protein [Coprococcus comes]
MMEMQGNATEIDERNLLQLDALLSHGYGLSPQLVMRSKGLSIEAKALYGYLSSFAGAGDTAFPSTSRILEELDISKNRFYKIRKELVSWGFISIETTATSAGLRTVYTLPQNPIAIKTEIDEIANRRNEIKSSLVANLHNEDMVSHKGDSESERLQQSAGNEPCRQSEAKAQNRGSNLKPCLQSEDEGCLQSGDKLYIDTNINPKVSIDRSAAHPSDDEGSKNIQIQGRDLIDAAEIGKMNRREAILLIAGTNPLKDLKYPVEQHPSYIYLDPGRNKPGQVKNRCLYDEPFDILEYMDEIRTKDATYAS